MFGYSLFIDLLFYIEIFVKNIIEYTRFYLFLSHNNEFKSETKKTPELNKLFQSLNAFN